MCRTWKEPRCCRIQLSYWSVFWTIRGCSSSRRLSDRIRSISLWTQLGSWVCLNACSSIFLQLVWIRCINVCVLQLFNAIIIIPLTFSNSIQSNRLYEKHNNDVNIYLEDTQYREVKSKLKSNRFKDGIWSLAIDQSGSNISFDVKVLACFVLNHLLCCKRVLSFKLFLI